MSSASSIFSKIVLNVTVVVSVMTTSPDAFFAFAVMVTCLVVTSAGSSSFKSYGCCIADANISFAAFLNASPVRRLPLLSLGTTTLTIPFSSTVARLGSLDSYSMDVRVGECRFAAAETGLPITSYTPFARSLVLNT
jgi:hypothetical protein